MQNEQTAIALLIFRVGPVLCCTPANPVQSIIAPPKLTRPPGSSDAKPGIFYHANHVISVNDLRHRFGVSEAGREQPGRLIISQQEDVFTAYWVDEIIEVIDMPQEGWSEPPSHLPKGVFNKALLRNEKIYLYADFSNFEKLPESGYLNHYIDQLTSNVTTEEAETKTNPDKHVKQVEPIAVTNINSTPVPENETAAQTKANPTHPQGEVVAKIDTDEQTNDELTAQLTTDQPSQLDKADALEVTPSLNEPEPTQIESLPSTVEDKLDSSNLADVDDTTKHDTQIIAPEETDILSTQQTDTNHQAVNSDIEANTITPIPPPIAIEPAEQITKFETTDLIKATEEEKEDIDPLLEPPPQTTAERANKLKNEYLNPVPAMVPESDIEPAKPPFPWQNLAAAVVLFVTIAGIGIYYLWPSSNKAVYPQATDRKPAMTQQMLTTKTEKPILSRQQDNTNTKSTADDKSTTIPATANQQDNAPLHRAKNEYHAEIKPDNKGVTIVLESPEKGPVLKRKENTKNIALSKIKDNSTQTGKHKKTKQPHKEEIIHIVIKGDTLWAIAEHYVNNPYKYPKLARLSEITNPDRIYPGNQVRILRRSKNTD